MVCPNCGADNREGSKFCSQCGAVMARACANCGTSLRPDARFCDECGTPVKAGAPSKPAAAGVEASAPEMGAERRLVTVLFADLVGFTALSENRDAEEVRELLTRYFETCRALVTRYGGVVEKFIGDAVMAVWGAPVAHEDDAERAVRAALDLVDAVATLGVEVGAPHLQARAGVLTGPAAVTLGAESQGMVAGDLVNTASRIQGAAQPGTVLVGDTTRQATEAAIVHEDAGERELKGKAEPVHVWRALRVVAGRGGALRSEALEAPFVGRDRELRRMKDLFHASAEERKAHLLSIVGIAGIGKTRLVWEFEKYIDGLVDPIYWHRGRCLAYGEGVTYWALAEMVRMRAGIVEAEEPSSARAKLKDCLAELLPDEEERRWAEPRLAQLIAIDEGAAAEREDLFSAWRLFFERLAEKQPTVLVFEDMQWADTSLLAFIEYLLEWSRNHALYVITSARPELTDRHPTWGAGKRNFTSAYLEPLTASAMEQLIDGLVPGLPDEVREQILRRAEGIPLYAVETVRMLLDRSLLERSGNAYRITGPIGDLAVPQSLQGLIAARLDGLKPEARRVLQDASVLGRTFTVASLAAVSGAAGDQLEPLLTELVRQEVLSLQSDPRSPERGQYGFLQDLVKRVAYETLSKRDRKEKHLAVAGWFEHEWGGEERDVVEVVASHYLEAYNLAPQDPDADQVRERAAAVLVQAGDRAASLAANAEAEHYFNQAAELMLSITAKAEMYERAGRVAWQAGRAEPASEHYERAIALYAQENMAHAAARVSAYLGRVSAARGHADEAVRRMEEALAQLANDPPDADLATLAEALGSLHYFMGDAEKASQRTEVALDISESLQLPDTLSRALNTKGLIAQKAKHPEESLALLTHALKIAMENELTSAALRGHFNLADALVQRDRYTEALDEYRVNLALARKVGDRVQERATVTEIAWVQTLLGQWDEALAQAKDIPETELQDAASECMSLLSGYSQIFAERGEPDSLERMLRVFKRLEDSADAQERGGYASAKAPWLRISGKHEQALAVARESFSTMDLFGATHQIIKLGFVEAVEAAFELDDIATVNDLLARIDGLGPGKSSPSLRAHSARFRGRLAVLRKDDDAAIAAYSDAGDLFRSIQAGFWSAVAELELGERLVAASRRDEAVRHVEPAMATFVRLGATPWITRARRTAAIEAVAS